MSKFDRQNKRLDADVHYRDANRDQRGRQRFFQLGQAMLQGSEAMRGLLVVFKGSEVLVEHSGGVSKRSQATFRLGECFGEALDVAEIALGLCLDVEALLAPLVAGGFVFFLHVSGFPVLSLVLFSHNSRRAGNRAKFSENLRKTLCAAGFTGSGQRMT